MKQHLSEPRPGAVSVMERRAHSDRCVVALVRSTGLMWLRCQTLPDCLPDDVDLMIEVSLTAEAGTRLTDQTTRQKTRNKPYSSCIESSESSSSDTWPSAAY
jgi:hypothetical protein